MKYIVILAVVAAAGIFAWNKFPGLRTSISQAANEYGGWTEEARQKDPVGFIQHAQKALQNDIAEFEEARQSLDKNKGDAEARLEEFRDDEVAATELANTMRELFKTADADGSWPVTYLDREYSRTDLVEQVEELLATKANAIERQADYQRVIDKVELTRIELRSRISDSKMALDKLAAQEAMVKVDRLSTEADALLAQVNELVEGNTRVAADPVRSVDELLQAAADQASAETKASEPTAAMDFLNS